MNYISQVFFLDVILRHFASFWNCFVILFSPYFLFYAEMSLDVQVVFAQVEASLNFFEIMFKNMDQQKVSIPLLPIGSDLLLACDIFTDEMKFVNTSTAQIGGLEYLRDFEWPIVDSDPLETESKDILVFSDFFGVKTGIAKCAGTFRDDGTDLMIDGKLVKDVMKNNNGQSNLETSAANIGENTLQLITKAPHAPENPSFFITFSGFVSTGAGFKKSESSLVTADDRNVIDLYTMDDFGSGVSFLKIEDTETTVSTQYVITLKNILGHSYYNENNRSPAVATILFIMDIHMSNFAFIHSPNLDKYDVEPCPSNETCLPDPYPMCQGDCAKDMCLANPNEACCENYAQEKQCIVFQCNSNFIEEACPCDIYPEIEQCQASSSFLVAVTFSIGISVIASIIGVFL